jgi:hypothetical protein
LDTLFSLSALQRLGILLTAARVYAIGKKHGTTEMPGKFGVLAEIRHRFQRYPKAGSSADSEKIAGTG